MCLLLFASIMETPNDENVIWKDMYEFPKFQISSMGDIKDPNGKIVIPVKNVVTIEIDGRGFKRHVDHLLKKYFPKVKNEWKIMPNYGGIQISKLGYFRNPGGDVTMPESDTITITLYGQRFQKSIPELIERHFPLMNEIWKTISEYTDYEVSNWGNFRNKNGEIMYLKNMTEAQRKVALLNIKEVIYVYDVMDLYFPKMVWNGNMDKIEKIIITSDKKIYTVCK